jgi:hypothetical protein
MLSDNSIGIATGAPGAVNIYSGNGNIALTPGGIYNLALMAGTAFKYGGGPWVDLSDTRSRRRSPTTPPASIKSGSCAR